MELFKKILILCLITNILALAGQDLENDNYQNNVVNSPEVWLIEYYSTMCGSCQQFTPVWDKVAPSFSKLRLGKVNIDIPGGMELAEAKGVLNEGIPCVKLVYGKNGEQITVMSSDAMNEEEFKKAVEKALSEKLGNQKDLPIYIRSDL